MSNNGSRAIAIGAVVAYALAYAASLAVLGRAPGFEAGEYLGVLLVFGIGYSVAAWLATIGVVPARHAVAKPRAESLAILAYLALFAVLVLGYGFTAVKAAVVEARPQELAMLAVKLATMVLLPAWLITRFGHSWREVFLGDSRGFLRPLFADKRLLRAFLVMLVLLFLLQVTIGRGPAAIRALDAPTWLIAAAVPLAFLAMSLEAGLCEEFLFRVLLQTRLAAWLRNESAAIVLMSLLFGLAHAPGYVLRGAHLMEGMSGPPDALTAIAYSIVVVSPIGLMFGVLWARTRSLALVVLVHGFTDLIPNLAPFVKTWLS
ncbi:MAG TPA: CPBP family intramembrane glutamic endopeptidase [Xanthomonadales bacterium]|nr:CPBP family intramembrane glutamic endopeptidase [Xanthomonadales bacterium]